MPQRVIDGHKETLEGGAESARRILQGRRPARHGRRLRLRLEPARQLRQGADVLRQVRRLHARWKRSPARLRLRQRATRTKWRCCRWGRPSRTTCTCPTAPTCSKATIVGEKICEAAHERGAKVVLLPTIPYGTETNQMAFPLAMNVNPSTLFAVITDLVESLAHHGIRKIVLLNSHGGNDLKPLLRELYGKTPAQLFLCNWYQVLADVYDEIFEQPDDHAGEMETSFGLAYFPRARRPQRRRHAGRRRRRDGQNALRGRQPRLGLDHPPLAPADDQQRLRQPARRPAEKAEGMMEVVVEAARDVSRRAIGREDRRTVSVLMPRSLQLERRLPRVWLKSAGLHPLIYRKRIFRVDQGGSRATRRGRTATRIMWAMGSTTPGPSWRCGCLAAATSCRMRRGGGS